MSALDTLTLTLTPIADPWQEYIADVTEELLIEATVLRIRGRLHAEALMALVAGLSCVREALRDPTLRDVGATIRVTIGNPEVPNA